MRARVLGHRGASRICARTASQGDDVVDGGVRAGVARRSNPGQELPRCRESRRTRDDVPAPKGRRTHVPLIANCHAREVTCSHTSGRRGVGLAERVLVMSVEPAIDTSPREELRVALVLNGGVSLAVWVGGVVHELDFASREPSTPRLGLGRTTRPSSTDGSG
jgi:hypothetical protein